MTIYGFNISDFWSDVSAIIVVLTTIAGGVTAYNILKKSTKEYQDKKEREKEREKGLGILADNADDIVNALKDVPTIKGSITNLEKDYYDFKKIMIEEQEKQKELVKQSREERRLMMEIQEADLKHRIKNGQNGNSDILLEKISEFKNRRIFSEES